ncbi:hypothetical protein ACQKLN_25850 [Paenibacillus glucanolyticus]|uniref:hypothetical protein n=1 Tax=Paenibacillus glucanolyticus TaxID=59843 RepID=UPI0036CE9341
MTNPVTPNIGLNKIDRTSPSTTYFDLEKYIDQNADAVDRFAGKSSEAIDALEKRLDTEERREVVLQPGLQIVNAERSAPFKLSGIKGRTLVNLLGRDGGCESVNRWSAAYQTSVMLDTGMKEGGSSSLKVSATGTASSEHYIDHEGIPVKVDAHYILVGMAKPSNNKSKAYMRIYGLDSNNQPNNIYAASNTVEDTASFKPVVLKFKPTAVIKVVARLQLKDSLGNEIYIQDGQSGNFDSIRIYEISATEYTALDSMTPEQIAAKYPYVDSVQPVRNPYVIRYGENLAPTLFEGIRESSTKVLSEYSAIVKATGSTVVEYRSKLIPAIPNTIYTLQAKITRNGVEKYDGVYVDVLGYDETGLYVLDTPGTVNTTGKDTFATPANIKTMEVRIVAPLDAAVGDYVIEDITLNVGNALEIHKPREDSILALQMDLYADPVTGEHADEVFEKEGQYFKMAKWKKVVLDGVQSYTITVNRAGYKVVGITWNFPTAIKDSVIATKHNGSQLEKLRAGDIDSASDQVILDITATVITISNTDSGWGVNYTPTVDEIKAYFMGWKMYDGGADASSTYNGTGLKAWVNLKQHKEGNSSNYTTTLPTVTAEGWAPYQIIYQLATPTVEPIVSEGMLTFIEGDNQIEVGTGIVLREGVKPVDSGDGTYWINGRTSPSYPLSKRPSRIQSVYKNNLPDNGWIARPVDVGYEYVFGLVQARLGSILFDPSANYSVTYLMLDKSPIAPFSGSYATNEKAMLQELTDVVQQNATAVSVLMNKKADKDAPGWITPTLLNGWIPYSDGVNYYGYPSAQYTKDSQGFVYLRGLVKKGSPSSFIFYLPEGYRPKQNITFVTICYDGIMSEQITRIKIYPNGSVEYMVGPTLTGDASWLSLNLPPFTLD